MKKTPYTFEDTVNKSDKEVTEMLKHNKRLNGWDESQDIEIPEPELSFCCNAPILNGFCFDCKEHC